MNVPTPPTAKELLDRHGDFTVCGTSKLLAARVEAALELHREGVCKNSGCLEKACCHCGFHWPCPTVRLLNGDERQDVSDLSRPPRGCLLALAVACLLWACAALWLAWRAGWLA